MTSIAVIDYGMGNLHSVAKALEHIAPKQRIRVTQQADEIRQADRVVFPGQGAIGDCMRCLAEFDLIDTIRAVATKKPFLGICLGPQALMEISDENGGVDCLGVFSGKVARLPTRAPGSTSGQPSLKVPHMGWNNVEQTVSHPLWSKIANQSRFYFVHSYYLAPAKRADTAGRTRYGIEFASALARESIFAVQFHPEKSACAGLQLLENFSRWDPQSAVNGHD